MGTVLFLGHTLFGLAGRGCRHRGRGGGSGVYAPGGSALVAGRAVRPGDPNRTRAEARGAGVEPRGAGLSLCLRLRMGKVIPLG